MVFSNRLRIFLFGYRFSSTWLKNKQDAVGRREDRFFQSVSR